MTYTPIHEGSNLVSYSISVTQPKSVRMLLDTPGLIKKIQVSALENIPEPVVGSFDIFFFPSVLKPSDPRLKRDYGIHGLVPASPTLLLELNLKEKGLGGKLPYNSTVWYDRAGQPWFITLFNQRGELAIEVAEDKTSDFSSHFRWWAGVLKTNGAR